MKTSLESRDLRLYATSFTVTPFCRERGGERRREGVEEGGEKRGRDSIYMYEKTN